MGALEPSGVPAHLQPLVDFLELDDRPTAIFERTRGEASTSKAERLVYRNPRFAVLRLNDDFVNAVVDCLREHTAADHKVSRASTAALRDWQLRAVGYQYESLVHVSTQHEDRDERQTDTPYNSAEFATHDLSRARTNESELSITDWTQYDVQDLSSWTQWVRSFDWSKTGLGPICSWSPALRGHMRSLMANPNPRLMVWGEEMTFVYNEACIPHWGNKHPHCFAKPIQEPWAEIWDRIGPLIRAVYNGEVSQQHNLPLPIWRNGFLEETYFNYTMMPIYGFDGKIEGIIDEIQETTAAFRSDRRRSMLVNFGKHISSASDLDALWSVSVQGLKSAVDDVAFALLYAVVDAPNYSPATFAMASDEKVGTVQACVLQGSIGLPTASPSIPETFLLQEPELAANGIVKACTEACKNRMSVPLSAKDGNMPEVLRTGLPSRAHEQLVERAMVTPIASTSGNSVLAVLITGLNPRSPFDTEYGMYVDYLGDLLTKAASAHALPQEQKRAQQAVNDVNVALSAKLRMVTLQAERNEAKFARMAAEAPTGMFVYGVDGRPLYANDEYLRILGESRKEHFGDSRGLSGLAESVHEDSLELYNHARDQVFEKKMPVTVEYRLKRPWKSIDKATGQEITGESWLLANAFPDLDYDGNIQSVQGWVTDISHRRFSEKLVSKKLEEALESKRLTENFIDVSLRCHFSKRRDCCMNDS